MEERIALMREYESGAFTVSELCERYEISRETFYVWKRRRDAGQERWFEERSRAPGNCPHATSKKVVSAILELRGRFPRFGPKKIRARLAHEQPKLLLPSASTIVSILKREGLIVPGNRRRRPSERDQIVTFADEPNDEWAMDFKGWFRTSDGERIDPLTISATASRYLIAAQIVPPTHNGVKKVLEQVFNEYGLPKAIRSDNGPPFGSPGAGGLSRLAIWFLKLGIEPRYIRRSSPQDNGRHERMHRAMKAETARPPAKNKEQQQARFDIFRRVYNEDRPHEG